MDRGLWKDLALAVLIGGVVGVSPHTSAARPTIKIAGGVLAGLVVLGVRRWRRRRQPARATPPGASEPLPLLAWPVLALPLLLFLPAATRLYRHYTEDIWTNGHGLFVPLVAVALALSILRRDPSREPESTPWGYPAIVAGLLLLVLDSAVLTLHVSIVGLVLLLFGLSLVLLGPRRTRTLAFPLLLLLFLIPLPTSLAMPLGLNQATTSGAALVFRALGSPTLVHEAVLERPYGLFGISANCSGFSTFYAAVALACVLGWCSRSPARLVLLLLAAWPLTALANILRTVATVKVWETLGPGFHATPLHGLSGIAAFWLVVTALFLMADRRRLRECLA